MSFSTPYKAVYTYLGFRGVPPDGKTDALIGECLALLEEIAQFQYRYRLFGEPPAFLKSEPYASFLAGCSGYVLAVTTLGAETDRRIKLFSRSDMRKSVVLDACASAYLETRADAYEEIFGKERTYRFCPGYGGSDIRDIRYIFELLRPEKMGVALTDEGYMLPFKTMAGVIGLGKQAKKSCGKCMMRAHCAYREEGRRCYRSEKT